MTLAPVGAGGPAASTASSGSPASHAAGRRVLINARLVPAIRHLRTIQQLIEAGRSGIVQGGDGVALALLPDTAPPLPDEAHGEQIASYLSLLQLDALEAELPLLNYPHEIVRQHLSTLQENMAHRLELGDYQELADGVFAARGARLGQYVVTDTTAGPIVLDQGASIGPYCYLRGPAYVGPGARVIEYAAIKDAVSIGHTTKIGGEVEASIVEPYTNKQHHGFLGHSYLGSWVNLGAGTCNSDLKNTYGQVNMEYFGQKVSTGMQFFGCVVGDYAKTAINTGIFTGKTIGAGSMVYGFVTTNVPSFVNYARLFGQVTEAPVEVLVATQARMFARRNVVQRPCDIQLLYDMHELTRHERQIAGEPLSL
jgi:UDP-N-acetylglucosamine diphosphorylase/glucosamine-1-phosphate N-acetyltransferase